MNKSVPLKLRRRKRVRLPSFRPNAQGRTERNSNATKVTKRATMNRNRNKIGEYGEGAGDLVLVQGLIEGVDEGGIVPEVRLLPHHPLRRHSLHHPPSFPAVNPSSALAAPLRKRVTQIEPRPAQGFYTLTASEIWKILGFFWYNIFK